MSIRSNWRNNKLSRTDIINYVLVSLGTNIVIADLLVVWMLTVGKCIC